MSETIDWQLFEQKFGRVMKASGGRPALPTRLMVGLHYLKGLYDESDESVVAKWVENPYWQYFCGEQMFQHELPCHPTSLVKWRKQIGTDGFEQLLGQIIQTAMRSTVMKLKEIERVNVDTTVQEKAVAFPTDARLYQQARIILVRAARKRGIKLRQSYVRVGKYAFFNQSRYRVARQLKRARKHTRKLRTYLGRVIRDIERKLPQPDAKMLLLLNQAKQIEQQQRNDSNKLYSMHAPEVECIAKGKVHKRYEFGCKVVFVTTSASNWIVGAAAIHGNPYDGSTLSDVISQTKRLTGVSPKQAAVDKGFRGTKYHPDGLQVLVAGTRTFKGVLRRLVKRRSAIEPVIGHLKQTMLWGATSSRASKATASMRCSQPVASTSVSFTDALSKRRKPLRSLEVFQGQLTNFTDSGLSTMPASSNQVDTKALESTSLYVLKATPRFELGTKD